MLDQQMPLLVNLMVSLLLEPLLVHWRVSLLEPLSVHLMASFLDPLLVHLLVGLKAFYLGPLLVRN